MRNNVSDTDHKLACPPPPSLARGLVASAVLALSAVGVLSGCGGGSSSSSPDSNPSSGAPAPAPIPAPAPGASGPETEPELPPTTAPSPSTGSLPTGGGTMAPPLPPTLQLPSGVDLSKPGTSIQGVKATSSAVENNNNGPDKAVDGSLTTRWASSQDDAAWIQFDFGAKTALGYMQLVWENAYGKEYAILASDDGQTWYQLRYVAGGKGGTEEFFNLNANVRYVKIQGVARATQYGYSLFEVSFKSPGSDNTLAAVATSALPTPPVGATIMTPAVPAPLEQVQFTLPDGTLVTRFGFVGRSRHARERGEDWAEIGYGTNDTVDANGKPRDKGPGAYLNFIANYFKNRTWGVEFIDNSRVPGVTKPRIIINQYYQQAQRGGGHSFFRRFDDPGVTGYGWMSPGQLLDPTTYTDGFKDLTSCPVVPKPPEGALLKPNTGYNGVIGANDGCSVVLDNVPGHRDVGPDANGVLVPTTNVASRSLKVGDAIEFTGSFFSSRAAMDAIGDSGNFRYYTNEVTYVVGSGLRPWYGVQPRLMNAPLPEETLLGGTGSISYDYADNATFMFQQPSTQIGMQNMQRFTEGRRWIHTNMWTGDHNEAGNDRNTAAVGLQGPRFNQSTCFACHINNGRGLAPQVLNQRLDTMAVRTAAVDANGKQVPHPTYGLAVQMNARSQTTGALQDWGMSVRVAGFDTKTVTLADGTAVTLSKPRVAFDGPTPSVYSLRAAQPMIGMGLLEAIPDADILARVRSTPDEDGVKGQANLVYDPETGAVRVGRYGWKAAKVSLRHQSANAALLDMSVTSPLYPNRDCLAGPAKCDKNKVEKGLSEADLQLITRYVALLGVPAQRSVASGFPKGVTPLPYLDVNPAQVAAGAKVFASIRCTACHVAEMKTGLGTELTENRNQTIRPYTDLLLHDMGADLADNLVESQAAGNQWRTAPLWGIGYTEYVAGTGVKVGYLHDSRASTLTEAILWHGGEATASRQRFINLSTADRKALMAFLNSL